MINRKRKALGNQTEEEMYSERHLRGGNGFFVRSVCSRFFL